MNIAKKLKDAVSSITAGPRESNFELLRIVAMLLVLVVHADFVAIGAPDRSYADAYGWLSGTTRVFFEMAAMVCVNLFVLISGWFSIKTTVRGFCGFMFQCIFFFTFTYVGWLLITHGSVKGADVASCFCLSPSNWFVKAYVGLYIVAPLLNLFCEKVGEQSLRYTVVLLVGYQTIWGWLGPNNTIDSGYTAFSFICLYLLARYMRLYYRGTHTCGQWLAVYWLTVVLNTAAYFLFPTWLKVDSYANPLVVIGALSLFMWFAQLKIEKNRWINFVAKSAFAVYLFHAAPKMMAYYKNYVSAAYDATHGVLAVLAVAGVIAAYFVVAVIVDRVRIFLWESMADGVSNVARRTFLKISSR